MRLEPNAVSFAGESSTGTSPTWTAARCTSPRDGHLADDSVDSLTPPRNVAEFDDTRLGGHLLGDSANVAGAGELEVNREVDVAHARLAVGPGDVHGEALEELHLGLGATTMSVDVGTLGTKEVVVHPADTIAILELVVEVMGIEPGVTVDIVDITDIVNTSDIMGVKPVVIVEVTPPGSATPRGMRSPSLEGRRRASTTASRHSEAADELHEPRASPQPRRLLPDPTVVRASAPRGRRLTRRPVA